MAQVAIRRVEKYCGTTRVIHGVDVDVADGEFAVLVDGKEVLSAGAMAVLGVLPSIAAVKEAIERVRSR